MIDVTWRTRGFQGCGTRAGESSKEHGKGGSKVETVEDSYYYQFACLRSLDLPLSSFHLDDARGLFPPIYFLDPNKRLATTFLHPSSLSLDRAPSRIR